MFGPNGEEGTQKAAAKGLARVGQVCTSTFLGGGKGRGGDALCQVSGSRGRVAVQRAEGRAASAALNPALSAVRWGKGVPRLGAEEVLKSPYVAAGTSSCWDRLTTGQAAGLEPSLPEGTSWGCRLVASAVLLSPIPLPHI